jgi:uncharacterized Zn finger protein
MQEIISECPVCSGREVATGKIEMRKEDHNRIYLEFRCLDCGSIGMEWSQEIQKLFDQHTRLIGL